MRLAKATVETNASGWERIVFEDQNARSCVIWNWYGEVLDIDTATDLTRADAAALWPIIKRFAETGRLGE